MLILRVRAAFAGFRNFAAGAFRGSAPFMTPSAAYGLVLNLAGVESRRDDGESVMTLTAQGLPTVSIALGAIRRPQVCSIYQQLHNYPVTTDGKEERLQKCWGGKYNIQPVRREVLCGFDGYLVLNQNEMLEGQVRESLEGGVSRLRPDGRPRYGVPFLGDNNYLIDRLDVESGPQPSTDAYWYSRLRELPEANTGVRPGTCRMTIWIDRKDLSRTTSDLYVPDVEPRRVIPSSAWTRICGPEGQPDGGTGIRKG